MSERTNLRKSQQQRQLLLAYIEQIGMKGSCAIVDIGWHGSMQYCLEQIAKYNGLDLKIYGYYIGISPQFPICGFVVDIYIIHKI